MHWLIIVIVVLAVLPSAAAICPHRQLARSRPAFERALAHVDRTSPPPRPTDRGWDRERLEAAARRICTEQFGAEPEELTLVEVIDRPGPTRTRPSSTSRAGDATTGSSWVAATATGSPPPDRQAARRGTRRGRRCSIASSARAHVGERRPCTTQRRDVVLGDVARRAGTVSSSQSISPLQ